MLKLLEKMVYAGVGAMAITEEKAREIVSELEKRGHLTSEEGSKLVNDLVERGKTASEDVRKTIAAEVERAMKNLRLVKKEDFDVLSAEVHDLNVKMDLLLSQRKEKAAS